MRRSDGCGTSFSGGREGVRGGREGTVTEPAMGVGKRIERAEERTRLKTHQATTRVTGAWWTAAAWTHVRRGGNGRRGVE